MAHRNIVDFLKINAEKYPSKIAVVMNSAILSYGEINQKTDELSGILKINLIQPADRVGIFLNKSLEEVISIFGVIRAGAVFVILNSKLREEQILHIVHDCGVKGIITNKGMYESTLSGRLQNSSVNFVLFTNSKRYTAKILSANKRVSKIPPAGKKIACIIYTSGSTGKPKGVMVTHKNLIDGADIVSRYLHCRHDDRVLSVLPFSFDYGLNQLFTTFRNGATIVLHNFVFPEDALRAIEKEKITALAGIPTLWISLLNFPFINRYNLSSLRYITNSGGKIPVEYVKNMIKIFSKTKIYLMYGLTEAFRSTYLPPKLIGKKPDSIGKAIPRVKISVLNQEGKECAPEEEGELVHRGALISMGYWGNRKATYKRIRELPYGVRYKKPKEIGVFSGDLVKRDKEGFLYFLGRNDEMIKSSGYRISPTEIEEVLYKIKNLTGAIVFGKEDAKLGEKIVAVVCCSKKIKGTDKILSFCKKYLPDYSVPHEVILVEQMPKTSSGKLDRSLIKGRYDEYKKA